MNVFNYPGSQRFRNNRSVTSKDDLTNGRELMPVSVVGPETLVPVLAILGHTLLNKLVQAEVFGTRSTSSLKHGPSNCLQVRNCNTGNDKPS